MEEGFAIVTSGTDSGKQLVATAARSDHVFLANEKDSRIRNGKDECTKNAKQL